MGRKKDVIAHENEIRCCGIAIPVDPKLYESAQIVDGKPQMGEELKQFMHTVKALGDKYNFVGLQVLQGHVIALFKDVDQKNAIEFCKELEQQGIKSNPVRECAYIDKRYLEGIYKGVQVKLPPVYLEKAIVDILDEYCFDWQFTADPIADILAYVGTLGGGREVHIMLQHGDGRMAAGINHGTLRQTDQVSNYYKQMLKCLEEDIVEWCDNHPYICKRGAKA